MPAAYSTTAYRPEIQGLRTIGALLVATFHIWVGKVSGGVDVFFVVSGFLITGSLVREWRRTGVIDAVGFWKRIAVRIAPMAYLVLSLTCIAGLVLMPRTALDTLGLDLLFSALHLENLRLMTSAVDYLARDDAPSATQQFWALSVQVQLYAAWPILLIVAAQAAKRAANPLRVFGVVLLAIFAGSLSYSIVETDRQPEAAYFNTLARVWEFALGGLVALLLPHLRLPQNVQLGAGWLGLAAILSCGFALPPSAMFPGYAALWPTLGAALVLLGGSSGSRFGADRLLAWKPLVALGQISFPFYLWHWPVLIFAFYATGRTSLGLMEGAAVIAVALCGAAATTRWLERPSDQPSSATAITWSPRTVALGVLALPALVIIALAVRTEGAKRSGNEEIAPIAGWTSDHPGGHAPMSLDTAFRKDKPLLLAPPAAETDLPAVYRDRCIQNQTGSDVITCRYGAAQGASKVIALVGGSHSAHWLPALQVLAERYKWEIVTFLKSACSFGTAGKRPSCVDWNRDVPKAIIERRPDVVFTTSTRFRYIDMEKPNGVRRWEVVPDEYLAQWSLLSEAGVSIVAVRDNPEMKVSAPECIDLNWPDIMKCARPRTDRIDIVDPTTILAPKPTNVAFIDLTDRFCDSTWCPPVGGNIIIYRDKSHITASYARTLAPILEERMRKVRPDLFVDAPGAERSRRRLVAEPNG